MASKPTAKHPVFLKEKATGNHALDSYAYGKWPHLFNTLALKYEGAPASLLITLLFLWDRTVGKDEKAGVGDIALSQIPLRRQEKVKWLAALVAADFFQVVKTKPGGAKQEGSFYAYENPTADEWDEFFRRAEILDRFPHWDATPTERFARLFADIRNHAQPRAEVAFHFLDLLGRGMQEDAAQKRKSKAP